MTYKTIIQALKGGKGSGNFGHASVPGKLGGSAPGSITSAHISKLITAINKSEHGKISSGYIGKDKTAELQSAGFLESIGGPYYKLTPSGHDLVSGKIIVPQEVKIAKPRAEPKKFDPADVKPNDNLSYSNALEYMKTLPGYESNVEVVKMTDTRSIRTSGATAAARYYEGSIELPSKTRARTIAHELGHYIYIYDFGVDSNARNGVHSEFTKAKASYNEGSPLRSYAMRYAHEFFADVYSRYLYGDESGRRSLRDAYPHTSSVVEGIITNA